MGPSEIAYRMVRAVQGKLEQAGFGLAVPKPPAGISGLPWCGVMSNAFDVAAYRNTAERVLAGRWNLFAMRDVGLGFPPAWNRDPRTGTAAPMVFGKTLDYRNERIVGDIKYLWELNRHLELVTLAQAWRLTNEARFAEGCRTFLDSWFEQCPYPLGVNWTSSLEHAVRLVNWSFAWHMLGGDSSPLFADEAGMSFRDRWLRSIFQHCHFIAGHFSLYSSANNHLLGEYMGLLVGAVTWPMWPESSYWRQKACDGFEAETLRQNTPDGVNREQAVYYQHEVTDMMLLTGLICRANGIEFGADYWERIERMMEFLAAIMDCAGNVPMIGDADDALMVRLDHGTATWSPYRSLLATGAVLFKRGDFKVKAGEFDDKSRWLLGDDAQQAFDQLPAGQAQLPVRTAFQEGGYFVLGTDFETTDEIRIVADAGPLGYLTIAAHGHADALAFTLSVGGAEFLVDTGTFAYHTQKQWRDYFRGTAAHNTIRIDDLDQSVPGGNFMWLEKANAHCSAWRSDAGLDALEAWHDGYTRLMDPVVHRRTLRFDKKTRQLLVEDCLECAGTHKMEMFWHFSEQCEVALAGNIVTARNGPKTIKLRLPEGDDSVLYRGSLDPVAGWISRRFDEKTPASTIVWPARIGGTTRILTTIDC